MKEQYLDGWEVIRTIHQREWFSTNYKDCLDALNQMGNKHQCTITPCKVLISKPNEHDNMVLGTLAH
jgi:hypothetical protein